MGLSAGGAGISLSAEVQSVRPGKTTEITAEVIGYQEGDIISWESSAPDIAEVDENGVVTGISQGTAVITGKVVRGGDDIAAAEIEITVLREKGNLIAEFTFDDEENGFTGAGAAAVKANAAGGISITEAEGHGNVLKFDSQPGGDYNWCRLPA